MRIIKIKNLQATDDTYCGQTIIAGEYYQLKDEAERQKFSDDAKVNLHLWESTPKILINDGESDLSASDGDKWLKGNYIQEVTPTVPKNEYGLRPYGMIKAKINSADQISDITLSNKDGQNIDYSGSTAPVYYDCIFQDDSVIRDGVYLVDGNTITTFNGVLSNGDAKLSKPVDIDYKITTIEDANLIHLWGLFINAKDYGEDDIARLQIVDLDGIGVTLGWYTQEQFNAMGNVYVVKEYDECWIGTIAEIKQLDSINGRPAEIPNGLHLRVKYYAKDISKINIRVWLDYKIALKSGDGID